MAEDDIVELLWKSGQALPSSQAQRPSVPPPILRGSGSGSGGGGEESAPLPLPLPLPVPLPVLPPPPPLYPSDHNLFIREDEMASWLHHHPLGEGEDELRSHLFFSGLVSTTFTQPHGSLSLTPPLPLLPPPASVIYTPTAPAERPTGQVVAGRSAENFISFSRLGGNVYTGGRVEEAAAAPSVPLVRDLTQVGSSGTPSSSVTGSYLTPAITRGVGQTFALPRAVCEIPGPSSEPFQVQLAAMETEGAEEERKRKEREETAAGDAEEAGGSTTRKRSRATELHNISERKRRVKINEKMKTLQELIPRCNKTDRASMLDDAIEYVKALQLQIQMISTGGGMMPPMIYNPNMQRFMPPSAMGMMGMNMPPFIPFPDTAFPRPPPRMAGLAPPYPAPRYPFPNIQAFDPSRVQPPDPVQNQPQFPGYMNPYSQFVGLQPMQQQPPPRPPPPLLLQLSTSQASGSKEPKDQDNKPTG